MSTPQRCAKPDFTACAKQLGECTPPPASEIKRKCHGVEHTLHPGSRRDFVRAPSDSRTLGPGAKPDHCRGESSSAIHKGAGALDASASLPAGVARGRTRQSDLSRRRYCTSAPSLANRRRPNKGAPLDAQPPLAGESTRYHSAWPHGRSLRRWTSSKPTVDVLQHGRVGGSSLTKCPL